VRGFELGEGLIGTTQYLRGFERRLRRRSTRAAPMCFVADSTSGAQESGCRCRNRFKCSLIRRFIDF